MCSSCVADVHDGYRVHGRGLRREETHVDLESRHASVDGVPRADRLERGLG